MKPTKLSMISKMQPAKPKAKPRYEFQPIAKPGMKKPIVPVKKRFVK